MTAAAAAGLCRHDLDRDWCADCTLPAADPVGTVTAIASFQSYCPACDEPVLAGELITLTDDDEWIHSRCTDGGDR